MPSRAITFLLAICLACVALRARRGTPTRSPTRVAKRHCERGQKLFGLQKFDQALEQFQKAFDAKPIPTSCSTSASATGTSATTRPRSSASSGTSSSIPRAANREQVEELITQLEEKRRAPRTPASAGSSRSAAPPRDGEEDGDGERDRPEAGGSPIYKKWWFWTGVAVVGVAGGVGIYAATSGGPPDTSLGKNIVFGK